MESAINVSISQHTRVYFNVVHMIYISEKSTSTMKSWSFIHRVLYLEIQGGPPHNGPFDLCPMAVRSMNSETAAQTVNLCGSTARGEQGTGFPRSFLNDKESVDKSHGTRLCVMAK